MTTCQSNQDQGSDCPDRNTESQRLREQVAFLELALARRNRDSLLLGVLLLAFCPYPLYIAGVVLDVSPFAYTFAHDLIHGSLAGCLLAQWSLISAFCMLNRRPAWERCAIFVGLATLMAAASVAAGVVHVWILADVLESQQRSWGKWLWRIPLLVVAGGIMLVVVLSVSLQVDRARFSRFNALEVSKYPAAVLLATSLVFWCGCRWMRMLGYRLYRATRPPSA